MNSEKLNDILKNESFMKEVLNANSSEDFKRMFKNKGVDLSNEDVEEIANLVRYGMKNSIEECDMSSVSGGRSISSTVKNIAIAISSLIIAGGVFYVAYNVGGISKKLKKTSDDAQKFMKESNDKIRQLSSEASQTMTSARDAIDSAKQAIAVTQEKVDGFQPSRAGRWLFGFGNSDK